MKLRIIAVFLPLLTFLNCGYASTHNTNNTNETFVSKHPYLDMIHPYIGGQLGYDSTKLNASFFNGSNQYQADYGLNGATYAGYLGLELIPANKFRLGLEAFTENVINATASDQLVSPAPPLTFQKKGSFGFSILPGYQFTKSNQIFIRLGVVRTQFSYDNSFILLENYSAYANGGQFGIGSLWNITQHLGIRGEYDRTNYLTLHPNGTQGSSADNDYLKYSSNEFKAALQWTF